jgi:transposase
VPEPFFTCKKHKALNSSYDPSLQQCSFYAKVKFSTKKCKGCELKPRCTCTKGVRRTISLRTKENYLALQQARKRQKDDQFWLSYRVRAGIEGTLSQGVSHFGLRKTRYRGMAKTHLQHLISATGLNILRYLNWLDDVPLAITRISHFAKLAA